MPGSGREALWDGRQWSGGPLGCPGVVERPSRMSGSGREALPDGRESLPDGREALLDIRDWFRRPFRMSGSGRVALLDVREWTEGPPG